MSGAVEADAVDRGEAVAKAPRVPHLVLVDGPDAAAGGDPALAGEQPGAPMVFKVPNSMRHG
jgi:hypothetical protein